MVACIQITCVVGHHCSVAAIIDDTGDDDEPEPNAVEFFFDNDESNFVSYAKTVAFLGKVQRSA
jgi:hypothetical protein